jgi:tricorn protease
MDAMRYALLLAITILAAVFLAAADNPGYYRFPTIHGNTIVFTAEGDLWVTGTEGGVARRLTSHPGVESNAAVSPDGATVAFSAEYEGPTEVYTMPLNGGVPLRRTFDGNARVVGWTGDGRILYATNRFATLPNVQLLTLDLRTGRSELLPLAQASDGSFDGNGKTLYFTRLAFQGSHTKRYRGGTAQNIWKFTPGDTEAIPLSKDYDGTSKTPLWHNGRIYFATDRDGTMNLWSMNTEGKDLQQHTSHKGWDLKSPSIQGGKIVYQLGADIHLYDIAANSDRLVAVTIPSDFDQLREKWVKNPMEYMTSYSVSPTGDRIALTARGQIFVAPAEQGRFVRVTDNNRIRYRQAVFMPDGKALLALSDESGETEFVTLPANGAGKRQALTNDAKVLRWGGEPSPDGKRIAYTDKNEELWIFTIDEKKNTRILKTEEGGPGGLAWSPDSKWLAYSRSAGNFFNQICLYNVENGKTVDLTSDRVDSYNPAWSPDGKWIYFLSDRVFQSVVPSPWGARQPEPYFDKTRKVYAIALSSGLRFPFQPGDEVFASQQGEKPTEKKDEKNDEKKGEGKTPEKKVVEVKIELNGLARRVFEVPLPAGAYGSLAVNDKYLYLSESQAAYQAKTNLVAVEVKNKDVAAKTVLEDIRSYDLSRDGKKVAVRKGDDLYVFDANGNAPADLPKAKVNLSNWLLPVEPREEFRQMFLESWRLERDYFYDPGLHSVDQRGLLEKHLPLVERVTDRDELADLISNLVGELSALHIFVYGGDVRRSPDKIGVATLGARLMRDEKSGGYRISHIYQSDPDYLDVISPLSQPGVGIAEGDVILAINGSPMLSVALPDILLKNQAGQQVLLTVRPADGKKKEFDAIVRPMSLAEEDNLRYTEWEQTRRLRVEEKGKGEIGYVHLRAMGGGNYSEWVKNFYPVFDRKGLIIDVRHNRGGNIDSWILEKLLRKAWFYWQGRVGKPTWNMQHAFRGHMVVLCNERTASDGEAFAEGFRRLGLGKVIGTRTWGGEIWLSSSNLLVDRGVATAAEWGVFGPEGEWLIEGRGVEPDIVVDNLPHASFEGEDAQLDAALDHLRRLLKEKPVEPPKAPRYPNKAFRER